MTRPARPRPQTAGNAPSRTASASRAAACSFPGARRDRQFPEPAAPSPVPSPGPSPKPSPNPNPNRPTPTPTPTTQRLTGVVAASPPDGRGICQKHGLTLHMKCPVTGTLGRLRQQLAQKKDHKQHLAQSTVGTGKARVSHAGAVALVLRTHQARQRAAAACSRHPADDQLAHQVAAHHRPLRPPMRHDMSRIHHRSRWVAALVAACLVALLAAPRAQADVPFMVVPQAPMVSTPEAGSDEQGRTDQTSVAFEVEGSWTQLSCQLDDQTDTTCGTPVTPCPVAQCTMVSRSGLRSGSHELFVTDPYGDSARRRGRHTHSLSTSRLPLTPTWPGCRAPAPDRRSSSTGTRTTRVSRTRASARSLWPQRRHRGRRARAAAASRPRSRVGMSSTSSARGLSTTSGARRMSSWFPTDPVPCSLAPIRPLRALQFEVYGRAPGSPVRPRDPVGGNADLPARGKRSQPLAGLGDPSLPGLQRLDPHPAADPARPPAPRTRRQPRHRAQAGPDGAPRTRRHAHRRAALRRDQRGHGHPVLRTKESRAAMRSRFTLTAAALAVAVLAAPQAQAAVTRRVECSDATSSECVLVTEYPIPPPPQYSTNPGGITAGPDGRMWFTENEGGARHRRDQPDRPDQSVHDSNRRQSSRNDCVGAGRAAVVQRGSHKQDRRSDDERAVHRVLTARREVLEPTTSRSARTGASGLPLRAQIRTATTKAMSAPWQHPGSSPPTRFMRCSVRSPRARTAGSGSWMRTATSTPSPPTARSPGTHCPTTFMRRLQITAGPDSRIWVTNGGGVAAVTTTGSVGVLYESYVPLVGRQDRWASGAWEITAGPDGRLWYFDGGQELLSAMTPSGAQSGVFLPVGVDPNTAGLAALATAPSGAHHVAEGFGKLWVDRRLPGRRDRSGHTQRQAPGWLQGAQADRPHRQATARRQVGKQALPAGIGHEEVKANRKRAGRVIAQRLTPGSHHEYGTRVAVVVGERRARRSR